MRKAYKDVVAVDGIDLEVRTGECFGLLGPNGAGKTTTIEICEGLTKADSGEVSVLGMHWDSDAAALRQRLGIQLQETQLSEKLTVLETVRLFRSFYRQGPSIPEVIAEVQLGEKLNSRVGGLSGGQKQRACIARAIAWKPRILVLDDALSAVDTDTESRLFDALLQKLPDTTIILISHRISTVKNCDRIIVLKDGTIAESGTHEELLRQEHIYAELYNQHLLEEEILSIS